MAKKKVAVPPVADRPDLAVREFTEDFLRHLFYTQATVLEMATPNDLYSALACTIRNRLLERWLHTASTYNQPGVRMVSYLSAEFLLGPHLENNLVNLDIERVARAAIEGLGLDLDAIVQTEEEPGLGNGGLGRLAACYMESPGDAGSAGDRVRHPLRVRHLRPGDPRRLAGGNHRHVAAPGQPVGDPACRRSPTTSSGAGAPSA